MGGKVAAFASHMNEMDYSFSEQTRLSVWQVKAFDESDTDCQ